VKLAIRPSCGWDQKTLSGPHSISGWEAQFLPSARKIIEAGWQKRHSSTAIYEEEGHRLPNEMAETGTYGLIEKLMAHALRVFAENGLYGKEAVISGVGVSAEDFAWDILRESLIGKLKNKDLPYLLTALRNDIVDKLRLDAHEKTDHYLVNPSGELDAEKTKCLDGFASSDPRADDVLCDKSYEDRVRGLVADEPELREVVEAVFDLQLTKPGAIAEALGVSATEVYVRQKRLRRRLVSHKILEVPLEKEEPR